MSDDEVLIAAGSDRPSFESEQMYVSQTECLRSRIFEYHLNVNEKSLEVTALRQGKIGPLR